MTLLKTESLKKHYGKNETLVKALDGVDINIHEGEFVSIVGTSGSGKTTLLHLMGGLDRATGGSMFIGDDNLDGLTDEELTIFRRRKIGFVFQSYNLIPILSVYENITLPIELDGKLIDEDYINKIVVALGLKDKLNNSPNNLSGGQQQRVAIARALAMKPSIILADEPTGNLDSKTSIEVLNLLKMTSRMFNQTIIMITHNESIAQMADRTIHIEDGLVFTGYDND